MTNRTTSYRCIQRKKEKKNQDTCCCSTVKSVNKEILFADEKIFTVEETFNKQNDRVHTQSSKEAHELVPGIE